MSETDQRITKSHRLKPLTIYTPLIEGESITSWLVRASLRQGCDALTFIGYYWPHIQNVEMRLECCDFDKGLEYINPHIHEDMAVLARTSPEQFNNQTIIRFAKDIKLACDTSVAIKWSLPASKRYVYGKHGYPYCPECMKDDEKAYLKLDWRLAWNVCCNEHKIPLQANCGHCNMPYQPILSKVFNKYLNRCYFCDEKLDKQIDFDNSLNAKFYDDVIKMQKKTKQVWQTNHGVILNRSVTAAEWFEYYIFIINLVRKALSLPDGVLNRVFTELKVDFSRFERLNSILRFEQLSVADRITLIHLAYQLFRLSEDDWIYAIDLANASKKSFVLDSRSPIPMAFLPIYNQIPDGAKRKKRNSSLRASNKSPKTFDTVFKEWQQLKRNLEKVHHYERHLEQRQRE